jgi:hypothetical protein
LLDGPVGGTHRQGVANDMAQRVLVVVRER